MARRTDETAQPQAIMRQARDVRPMQEGPLATRRGLILATALFGVMVLPGCLMEDQLMTQPQSSAKATAAPAESMDTNRLGAGCELKNVDGTGSCEDGRGDNQNPEMTSTLPKQTAASNDFTGFSPEQCGQGAHLVDDVWGAMLTGRMDDYEAYCRTIESGQASAPTAQKSRPTAQKGGGCEWRGSSYAPGDTIYPTDGPILSQDLFINGQSFDNFTGKPGPWQMCECQVSVGHWGCV